MKYRQLQASHNVIYLLLTVIILCIVPSFALGELKVVFLDVGQGDSTVILCDGIAMLVDGGRRDNSQYIYTSLKDLGINQLSYVVATHPDSDHIGGLPAALEACDIGILYSPTWYSEDAAFLTLKEKAIAKNLPLTFPFPGEKIPLGSATVTFLGPVMQYGSSNNLSIVLRIDYGNTSFLFTGDAEYQSEADMLSSSKIWHADLLHVGHHGSCTSTSNEFLNVVSPSYAVISVGKDNTYGLPTEQTLKALCNNEIAIYRTDLQGVIIAKSDGDQIVIETERSVDPELLIHSSHSPTEETRYHISKKDEEITYVGNKKSMKFHYPSCKGVQTMSDKNKVNFYSREEAILLGYEPCGQCQP